MRNVSVGELRRATTAMFPRSEGGGVIASAAVGATVALFVGVVLLVRARRR